MGNSKKSKRLSNLSIIIIGLCMLLVVGVYSGYRFLYSNNLRPVSSSSATQFFTVEKGTSVHEIALSLEEKGLIRSSEAFEAYVRSRGAIGKLQAGRYSLSPSMSVQEIVEKMLKGEVTRNLLTILPGKRLDQIKQTFIDSGYKKSEVDAAFNPNAYPNHPALAYLPKGASLEGYLYPESFHKESNTTAKTIVRQSLDEMANYMRASLITKFMSQNLSVHEAVSLASIVYQESGDPIVERTIAQVFLTRLQMGMKLQSDITAFYASAIADISPTINIDSLYNTYKYEGIPPGPVSNFTVGALKAVANPTKTDYLYFVAGDDGKVYFSRTQTEHEQAVDKYCKKGCG